MSSRPSSSPDVIVVGGGVIGLSIAWKASERGLSVTVVGESPGRGASWAAAGMLAPVTEVHPGEEHVLGLGVASLALYPDFVARLEELTGLSTGYREGGTLMAAATGDDYAALQDVALVQERLGLEVERLKRKDARALEPALTPGLRAAWFAAGDHHIDNRALVEAVTEACKRSSVELVADTVAEVIVSRTRAMGVRLASGAVLDAGALVVAAGAWSGALPGIPDEYRPPVRPVKGQLLYLRGAADEQLLTHNVRGLDVYLVPRRDGRIVVGATVEERGFDMTVTAGAVYELLRDAFELVPGLSELELVECVAGLRPGSPDNAPMIGATGLDGLFVATGHYRNGILLTPLTAEAMAELLVSGTPPETIEPASPLRFREARA
ncbi:MAG TPA: glycine oxidase ThiO [Actinomycetota bacterium]|nr:glycine oxidase ThiO [Actinomycetota bacterium]